jgi:hypothetical protein
MINDDLPGWPKTLEIANLAPWPHGRVQVMTRISPEDKNNLMRVCNETGFAAQDVQRMFLMRGIEAYLAGAYKEVVAVKDVDERVDEVMRPHPSMSTEERAQVIEQRHEHGLEKVGRTESPEYGFQVAEAEEEKQGTTKFNPDVPPGVKTDES